MLFPLSLVIPGSDALRPVLLVFAATKIIEQEETELTEENKVFL